MANQLLLQVGHIWILRLLEIGVPLISYVGLEQIYPHIVVELSSYQLETCIDFPLLLFCIALSRRHGNMDDYMRKKAKCFELQASNVIFNETTLWFV